MEDNNFKFFCQYLFPEVDQTLLFPFYTEIQNGKFNYSLFEKMNYSGKIKLTADVDIENVSFQTLISNEYSLFYLLPFLKNKNIKLDNQINIFFNLGGDFDNYETIIFMLLYLCTSPKDNLEDFFNHPSKLISQTRFKITDIETNKKLCKLILNIKIIEPTKLEGLLQCCFCEIFLDTVYESNFNQTFCNTLLISRTISDKNIKFLDIENTCYYFYQNSYFSLPFKLYLFRKYQDNERMDRMDEKMLSFFFNQYKLNNVNLQYIKNKIIEGNLNQVKIISKIFQKNFTTEDKLEILSFVKQYFIDANMMIEILNIVLGSDCELSNNWKINELRNLNTKLNIKIISIQDNTKLLYLYNFIPIMTENHDLGRYIVLIKIFDDCLMSLREKSDIFLIISNDILKYSIVNEEYLNILNIAYEKGIIVNKEEYLQSQDMNDNNRLYLIDRIDKIYTVKPNKPETIITTEHFDPIFTRIFKSVYRKHLNIICDELVLVSYKNNWQIYNKNYLPLIKFTLDNEELINCFYLTKISKFKDDNITSHANVLVLNKNLNIIQRFDPHGIISVKLSENVIREIEQLFTYTQKGEKISPKFIDIGNVCPYHIQSKFNSVSVKIGKRLSSEFGLCVPWTWFYIFNLVNYPELTQEKLIINFLVGQDSVEKFKDFLNFILEINLELKNKNYKEGDPEFIQFIDEKFIRIGNNFIISKKNLQDSLQLM
jgi:hypothetical protein